MIILIEVIKYVKNVLKTLNTKQRDNVMNANYKNHCVIFQENTNIIIMINIIVENANNVKNKKGKHLIETEVCNPSPGILYLYYIIYFKKRGL